MHDHFEWVRICLLCFAIGLTLVILVFGVMVMLSWKRK